MQSVISPAVLEALDEQDRKILEALPRIGGATPDEIARSGIPVASVMVSLTMLEIKKLVTSLPGGL